MTSSSSQQPCFDVDRLRDAIGDDPEFEHVLLDEYLTQSAEILERLAGAIAANDVAGVRAAAHELKGSSRTIGAHAVGEVCQTLETLAGTGSLDGAPREHETLLHEFDRLRVAIHAHLRKAA
jgi:HPt (histidine-containing phosphotransfer) domain-containing protein